MYVSKPGGTEKVKQDVQFLRSLRQLFIVIYYYFIIIIYLMIDISLCFSSHHLALENKFYKCSVKIVNKALKATVYQFRGRKNHFLWCVATQKGE